jgi:protein phosphatase
VLIRYLGTTEPIQVDLRMRTDLMPYMEGSPDQAGLPLQAGDIILLTSDGVSDLLSDEEIKASLSGRRWERAVRRLIYNALKNGGHDNATAVAIRITKAN